MNSYKCYWKQDGKLHSNLVEECETPNNAIWAIRRGVLGEKSKWFEVKQAVMAVVK